MTGPQVTVLLPIGALAVGDRGGAESRVNVLLTKPPAQAFVLQNAALAFLDNCLTGKQLSPDSLASLVAMADSGSATISTLCLGFLIMNLRFLKKVVTLPPLSFP